MSDVTVILNVYNRPHTLEDQLKALYEQSVLIAPENIWVWYNKGSKPQAAPKNSQHRIFVCNQNTKFHGRFAAANLVRTKYVALFDDDVIMGKDWIANCVASIEQCNGIIGGSGVVLLDKNRYDINYKIGWNGSHSTAIERVDLVGHAWFFKQEWLKYMWFEQPVSWDNGEDIMFSYLCQKYGGINTYVPPHPDGHKNQWSNTDDGKLGSDENATYIHRPDHYAVRSKVCLSCIDNGWKTVKGL